MFSPGQHAPLYQQVNDPLLAYVKGAQLNDSVGGLLNANWGNRFTASPAQLNDFGANAYNLRYSTSINIFYFNGVIPAFGMAGGVGDYLYAGSSSAVASQTYNTFWCWARMHNLNALTRYFAGRNNLANNYSWSFSISTTMQLNAIFSTNGIALTTFTKSLAGYTLTDWHFYAMEFRQNQRVRMWIDDNYTDFVAGIPGALFGGGSTFRMAWGFDGDMVLPAWNGDPVQPTLIPFFNSWYMATRPMFGKVT